MSQFKPAINRLSWQSCQKSDETQSNLNVVFPSSGQYLSFYSSTVNILIFFKTLTQELDNSQSSHFLVYVNLYFLQLNTEEWNLPQTQNYLHR